MKCIHHFASVYYGDQGQLFDAPRQHRREKRLRRLERHKGAPEEYSSAHSQDEDSDEDDGDSKRTSDDRESDSDDDDPGKGGSGASASDEENRAARAPPKKDMYKIMDGSALMAIGQFSTPPHSTY